MRTTLVLAASALLACGPAEGAAPRAQSVETAGPQAPAVVSAAVSAARHGSSLEKSFADFTSGMVVPTALSGGSLSREVLVRRFLRAVQWRDTADIRAMVLDRAEFAHLYYPSSPYTRPPTVQAAPLAWFLLLRNSEKGITRVFNRFGGQHLEYVSHHCDAQPSTEGKNLFWEDCTVDVNVPAEGIVRRKLFGSILERDGRFKFLSYANDY